MHNEALTGNPPEFPEYDPPEFLDFTHEVADEAQLRAKLGVKADELVVDPSGEPRAPFVRVKAPGLRVIRGARPTRATESSPSRMLLPRM
jgi:hypothetical protein